MALEQYKWTGQRDLYINTLSRNSTWNVSLKGNFELNPKVLSINRVSFKFQKSGQFSVKLEVIEKPEMCLF